MRNGCSPTLTRSTGPRYPPVPGDGDYQPRTPPRPAVRHGLEGAYNAFYEEIYTDWAVWFDSKSKLPEGPSRLSNREAQQVLDKALVIFERYYTIQTGGDCPLTMDYLYRFMQIMGLERNVEWDDLSQWELNLLTTVEMTFAGLILSYLSGNMELDPDDLIRMALAKIEAVILRRRGRYDVCSGNHC